MGGISRYDDHLDVIARCRCLQALCRDVCAQIARRATSQRHGTRSFLFRRGDRADSFFVIAEGVVYTSLLSSSGREFISCVAGPGDLVGAAAYFDGAPREADCTVMTPLRVVSVPYSAGRALHSTLLDDLLCQVVCRQWRAVLAQTGSLALDELDVRLAKVLCMLDMQGEGIEAMHPRHFHQGLIAAMANGSRPKINRQLQRFHRAGAIALRGGAITSVDRDKLSALVRAAEMK